MSAFAEKPQLTRIPGGPVSHTRRWVADVSELCKARITLMVLRHHARRFPVRVARSGRPPLSFPYLGRHSPCRLGRCRPKSSFRGRTGCENAANAESTIARASDDLG